MPTERVRTSLLAALHGCRFVCVRAARLRPRTCRCGGRHRLFAALGGGWQPCRVALPCCHKRVGERVEGLSRRRGESVRRRSGWVVAPRRTGRAVRHGRRCCLVLAATGATGAGISALSVVVTGWRLAGGGWRSSAGAYVGGVVDCNVRALGGLGCHALRDFPRPRLAWR